MREWVWLFPLPSTGIMGWATLIAGTGSIRARAHALGSIPLGLASAGSHSAPVSQGLYTVNTPPWCHGTINPRLLGITARFMSFDRDQLDPKALWNSNYVKVGAHFCMLKVGFLFTQLCNTEEFSNVYFCCKCSLMRCVPPLPVLKESRAAFKIKIYTNVNHVNI